MRFISFIALLMGLFGFSLTAKAEAISGPISELKKQQRQFVLEGKSYRLPTTIPIKDPVLQDQYYDFELLQEGDFLKVRYTGGNKGLRTVIEAFILPQ